MGPDLVDLVINYSKNSCPSSLGDIVQTGVVSRHFQSWEGRGYVITGVYYAHTRPQLQKDNQGYVPRIISPSDFHGE